jgi:hypothetical protein
MTPIAFYFWACIVAAPPLLLATTVLAVALATVLHRRAGLPVTELAPGCAELCACRGLLTGDTHDREAAS